MRDKKQWVAQSQEAKVQGFYGTGVENYGDFHGGYLNFGLWEKGNTEYLFAAEHLVRTIGIMAGLNRHSQLLDVGCGMGPQDVFLHNTFGCRIDALDVTWKHVTHARARAQQTGLAHIIKVHHGTAVKLPFPDHKFTQVISIEAPEHFNTRVDFLKEAYRVLKPRGVIALADYVVKHEPQTLWEHFVLKTTCHLWQVPKANYDTSNTYAMKMKQIGFKNVTIKEVGKQTIPGYYKEATRKEVVKSQEKIRGYFVTHAFWWVDYILLKAFENGLIEYVLVRGEK